MSLATALELAVNRYPEVDAIVTSSARLSYREWNRRINSAAWGLVNAGIRPGDRVAILTGNGEAPATMYFAIHKAGATAVMLNARWKHKDIIYAINEAGIRAILYDQTTRDELFTAKDVFPQDFVRILHSTDSELTDQDAVAYETLTGNPTDRTPDVARDGRYMNSILYTSGTTGQPKGVCRSSKSDYCSALAIILEHRWERFERFLAVMPLYHTMGLHTLISSVLLNGTLVLLPKPEPAECIHYLSKEQVTALYLVPTIYYNLINYTEISGIEPLSVKKLAFAGAPMSSELVKKCFDTFQPEVFVNQYGCTEMLAITTNCRLDQKPLSVGRPALHTRIRIVTADRERMVTPAEILPTGETGEVIVDASSPQAFLGYLDKPDATERVLRDGWYFTGDLGFIHDDGDLYVVGRVDDMIITGGENVFPGEVEATLLRHPCVKEVAVVGLPDERWGQRITAFVVPASPGLTHAELERFCLESRDLPRFKRPRQFVFVKEIPKSPTGKVLRSRLRTGDLVPLDSFYEEMNRHVV